MGEGSQAKLLCKCALLSISTYRFFPFPLLSKECQAWHSCPSRVHDEIRMVLHLRLDLYARLAADPPSLVDTAITQHTSPCWLAEVIHREGRRSSGQPGVCCIGRHRKDLLFLIVDSLGDPQSREINAGDGRLVELAQVRLVEDPPPCLLATRLSRHDDGIGLPTRIRLGETKAGIEHARLSVPCRVTEVLGPGLQGLVGGSVPPFACVQKGHAKYARSCHMGPQY